MTSCAVMLSWLKPSVLGLRDGAKREIDKIGKISDLAELFEIAGDCSWSPEGRLFAAARCIAGLELRTERREAKPDTT